MPQSARSVGRHAESIRTWSVAVALGLGALTAPVLVEAWPAIQDDQGNVFLCDSRPAQLSDGRWACRSAGVNLVGGIVDVVRPGTPPGSRPWGGPPGPPGRWWGPAPWVRPPSAPSGYDALDPWLGPSNSSER